MRIVIRVILYPPIPACSLKLEVRKCAVQAEVATCDWISRWHEVRQPHCHMCKFESLHRAILGEFQKGFLGLELQPRSLLRLSGDFRTWFGKTRQLRFVGFLDRSISE